MIKIQEKLKLMQLTGINKYVDCRSKNNNE